MSDDLHHAVGVCTFRRPALAETLATLEAQRAPDGGLTILVADNDDAPSARGLVEDFARTSRHEVVYLHAPARNISVARNAILAAARAGGTRFLAFIDDDECAPRGWYLELHAGLTRARADAAVGPVRAIYPEDAPPWLARARTHDTEPELDAQGRPVAGHSCNVLIDLGAPAFAGLDFSLERGQTGGEDTAFFHAARRRGAVLCLAADAVVTEAVTPDRAGMRWLLQRRYRMGQTHGSLLAAEGGGRAGRAALAGAKLLWCGGAALLSLADAERRNGALIRGALHAGVLAEAAGLRRVRPYVAPPRETDDGRQAS
ncbi:MAG: glycosyltransferase [Roseicyclus sp.]